jgi:outer membrane protein OmpA-like peptidoglycan-associated protein
MKLGLILFIFIIASILLVVVTIEQNSNIIYAQQIKKIKVSKIQALSEKAYLRTRKVYVPERSLFLARQAINNILFKDPIRFEVNDSSYLKKSTLIKIVKIINHVHEDVVLSILAHTDAVGTAKHNLYLSQKRADRLKEYFISKINLPLVVAIGYGKEFSLKNRLIEINLKRIK